MSNTRASAISPTTRPARSRPRPGPIPAPSPSRSTVGEHSHAADNGKESERHDEPERGSDCDHQDYRIDRDFLRPWQQGGAGGAEQLDQPESQQNSERSGRRPEDHGFPAASRRRMAPLPPSAARIASSRDRAPARASVSPATLTQR